MRSYRGCTKALREISARNRSCGWHCGGEPLQPAGLVCATLRKRDVTTVRVRLEFTVIIMSGPMTKNWDGELNAMMDRRAPPPVHTGGHHGVQIAAGIISGLPRRQCRSPR